MSIKIHITPPSREVIEEVGRRMREAVERSLRRNLVITGGPVSYDLADPRCRLAQPCDTCTAESSCKNINQCLRYKCEFGKVDKP